MSEVPISDITQFKRLNNPTLVIRRQFSKQARFQCFIIRLITYLVTDFLINVL